MIKFIHKRHMHENKHLGRIVIYYNATDIFLGTALLALVVFFINDYLSHSFVSQNDRDGFYMTQNYKNQPMMNPLKVKP